mmetsp:Transcript_8585/g.26071  ORF Transcript_8585/g.26071 Transcript_8585/m.26071 type:complete len:240 (-) Transcript_8585:311-1030(-)
MRVPFAARRLVTPAPVLCRSLQTPLPLDGRTCSGRTPVLMLSSTSRGVLATTQPQSTMPGILSVINESTKWVVSGIVVAVLLWHHDAGACWCVVGSVVAALNCKLLKTLINEARPVGARKEDPGMPSSHAQSLAFLSSYAALELVALGDPAPGVLAAATLAAGAFLSWLRVALGFHTAAQVLVGHALGTVTAMAWCWLGHAYSLPALEDGGLALNGLYAVTAVAVFGFATTVKRWKKRL